MRKTLFLLAALTAVPVAYTLPIFAQDTPAAVANNVQLHADIPAAAYLPQNVEAFIAIGNLDSAERIMSGSKTFCPDFESAAIGFGKGSSAALAQILPVLDTLTELSGSGSWAEDWAEMADNLPKRIINEQLVQHRNENFERMISTLRTWRVSPVYGVYTSTNAEQQAAHQAQLLNELKQDEGSQEITVGDWKGTKHVVTYEGGDSNKLSVLQQMQLKEALDSQQIYVMTRLSGNTLIVVLCSDPQQLDLPAFPSQSVLTAESSAFAAAHPQPIAMASFSPEFLATANAYNFNSAKMLSGLASGIFKTLAEQDSADRSTYQAAVQAINTLITQFEKLSPVDQSPMTLLAWADDKLHAVAERDAYGMRFEPSSMPELDHAEAILSVRADRLVGTPFSIDWAQTITACEQLADGIACTMDTARRYEAQTALSQYRLFNEERTALGHALTAWGEAFDGSCTLILDGKGQRTIPQPEGAPKQVIAAPNLILSCGVKKREKLNEGWNHLLFAAEQVMRKLGGNNSIQQLLPILSAEHEGNTILTLDLPDFSPSLAVNDERIVLSNSAELCKNTIKAPATTGEMPGISLVFRTKPLLHLVGNADSALDKAEGITEDVEFINKLNTTVEEVAASVTITPNNRMQFSVDITPAQVK